MAHYNDFWNLYVHIPKGQNVKRDRALGGGGKFADWGAVRGLGGHVPPSLYYQKRPWYM